MKNFDGRLLNILRTHLYEAASSQIIDSEECLAQIKAEIASQMPKEKEEFLGGFPAQAYNQAIQEVKEALQLDGVTRTDAEHQLEGKKE